MDFLPNYVTPFYSFSWALRHLLVSTIITSNSALELLLIIYRLCPLLNGTIQKDPNMDDGPGLGGSAPVAAHFFGTG